MTEDSPSDADCQRYNHTSPQISRRKLMRAGGVGAAMVGIAGYPGTAGATGSSQTHRSTNENVTNDGTTSTGTLEGLLQRNQLWSTALPEDYFSDVQTSQAPTVTSVCCSDSRVSQEGMFLAFLEAGSFFTPSNIGNKVISLVDGERVVNGNFLYGLENADSENGVVIGHTDCGAITAAYEIATGQSAEKPPGIGQEVEVLVDIVEEGLDTDLIDTTVRKQSLINQLVEYNVHQQIEFLVESEEVSDDRNLYGFVYDFQGAYAETHGRTYLVNINAETDQKALAQAVPDEYEPFVESLLH